MHRPVWPSKPGMSLNDVHESEPTPTAARFPVSVALLSRLAGQLGGVLGRALLVRLAPSSIVYPHIDEGEYYRIRDRYHYVIDSPSGSVLTAGDEAMTMKAGELWWFDNKQMHSSRNDGSGWRVHLIFDLLRSAGFHALNGGASAPSIPACCGNLLRKFETRAYGALQNIGWSRLTANRKVG